MTVKQKYIPGPWECVHIDKRKKLYIAKIIAKPSQLEIAEVFSLNYDELIANAKLIAAAPELYELLEEIVNEAIDYTNQTGKEITWNDKAKSIINKIKG